MPSVIIDAPIEDHLRDEVSGVEMERPAEPHHAEFDQHQPEAAGHKIAADRGRAAALCAVEIGRDAGEKDEDRRAEMRDPARHEQRGIGHVARIEAAHRKEVAGVVERHDDHDEAAQKIDRGQARPRLRDRCRGRDAGRFARRGLCRCFKQQGQSSFLSKIASHCESA
jgi:hypothetical protein